MIYSEVKITTNEENVEILQALFSQFEFDSFVDTDNGFDAYIVSDLLNNTVDNELKELQMQFDFTYNSKELENKNWNEEFEKLLIDPLYTSLN